MQLNIKLAEKL